MRPRLNARIILDGQKVIRKIQPNTIIKIRKANSHAKFISLLERNKGEGYINRLRKKILGSGLRIPRDDSPEE